MARRFSAHGSAALLLVLLLFYDFMTGEATEPIVVLEMPNFTFRGSSITLFCNHNLQPDELYKVEWRKAGKKIVQYIRERRPPFITYTIHGCRLNMSLATQRSIVLQDLDFSASGSYSCEVSMETPIFTKSSLHKDLQVIQPQKHSPKITFGATMYSVEDILEATCTTSPAYPPPHITWLVNGEKVDESLTKPTISYHHRIPGSMEMLASSTTILSVAVSTLALAPGGRLALTCLATIPAYKSPNGHYADMTNHTAIVDVVAEEQETTTPEVIYSDMASSSSTSTGFDYKCIIFSYILYELITTE